jgi:hypothetical protein
MHYASQLQHASERELSWAEAQLRMLAVLTQGPYHTPLLVTPQCRRLLHLL